MTLLGWAIALALLTLLPHALYVGALTAAATRALTRRDPSDNETPSCPRIVCLIPAHNEELCLERTVRSLQAVDYPADRFEIVVLADNCTDTTAAIGRGLGASVVERSHPTRRAKGFALEDTIPSLLAPSNAPAPDAIVVVDADTVVDKRCLRAFAKHLARGSDFIQGLDVVGNVMDSWRTKLMAWGFTLFNGTYMAGNLALGIGAHLRGNGMCLSRTGLLRHPWTAGGLAEDLEFSWRLRFKGERVDFATEAVFYADMPATAGSSVTQRQRWERGRGELQRSLRGRAINQAVPLSVKLLWLLDLTMPRLTSFAGAWGIVGLVAIVFTGFDPLAGIPLLAIAAIEGFCLALYCLSPFLLFALPWGVAWAFVVVPYYAMWRIAHTLGHRPTQWIRTARKEVR